jgi:hypothetical protein
LYLIIPRIAVYLRNQGSRSMKSYSAYFIRTEDLDVAQTSFSKITPVIDSSWLLCDFCKDDLPPEDEVLWGQESLTETKSPQLREIIFVYGDTSVDGFVYEHRLNGVLVRKLVWFPLLNDAWEAGWLCAEGESEDWEKALFKPESLTQFMEYERQRYIDEGKETDFTARETEIQEVWNAGKIIAGNTFPMCDGTVALLVEQSYGIKWIR